MDEVSFNEVGNEIRLVKRSRDPRPGRAPTADGGPLDAPRRPL
jgi:hypothetical protein